MTDTTEYNDVPYLGTKPIHMWIAFGIYGFGFILLQVYGIEWVAGFGIGVMLTVFAGHLRATVPTYRWAK